MKYLLPLLLLSLLVLNSCKEDDPKFIDEIEGDYKGSLRFLSCSLPQEEEGTTTVTAVVSKTSETTVDINMTNNFGSIFNFPATVSSEDSTIIISTFTYQDEDYEGNAFANEKFAIRLTDGCTIFGSESAVLVFDEN